MDLKRIFRFSKLQSEISHKQRVLRGMIGTDEEFVELVEKRGIGTKLLEFSVYHDEDRRLVTSATSRKLSRGIEAIEDEIGRRWRKTQNQEEYLARQLVLKLIDASLLSENDRDYTTNRTIYHQLLPGLAFGYKKNVQSVISLIVVTKVLEDWFGKIAKEADGLAEDDPNKLFELALTELLAHERSDALTSISIPGHSLTKEAELTPFAVELIPQIFENQGWTADRSGLTAEDLHLSEAKSKDTKADNGIEEFDLTKQTEG